MRKVFMAASAAVCLMVAMPQLALAQAAAQATGTASDPASDTGATPAKLALVKHMFAAMHTDTMIKQMMGQMTPGLVAGLRKSNPQLSDADADKMQKVMAITGEVMSSYMPKMMDSMAEAYADIFTTDELTAMDHFYESPVGQSMLAKTPQVMAKITPAIGEMMPQMGAEIQKRVCAEIGCPTTGSADKTKS
ncbi:DUF2059 domain-containing protein [Asticcacaulis sp. EMRT-3]|uniref:DUF2059 domain-containing protein n=1 Tax=Asticcacaulis sp. EMRT-3 TaxID=3040349 RepID=UPI0024AF26B6|nr:DUF2059 domain-containing protein [Asticcacaulis sp. EMRT-3]MDI7776500.1 DUF2059 domain-containing protein [Asticcacaulis sp. EMRT-3]